MKMVKKINKPRKKDFEKYDKMPLMKLTKFTSVDDITFEQETIDWFYNWHKAGVFAMAEWFGLEKSGASERMQKHPDWAFSYLATIYLHQWLKCVDELAEVNNG